jgi:sugar lactone lactonase YvrE
MKAILLVILNFTFLTQICVSQDVELELDKKIQSPDLGYLYGLVVDESENIYVSDVLTGNVKIFSSKGKLIQKIGKKGRGPGEFLIPKSISITDKRLYIYDSQLIRISLFDIDKKVNLVKTFPIKKNANSIPDQILAAGEEKLYSMITPAYTKFNLNQEKKTKINLIDQNGAIVKKSILEVEAQEYYIQSSGEEFGVGVMPFGIKPLFQIGNNHDLYYASNDEMNFYRYSKNGKLINKINYGYDKKIKLNKKDWEKVLRRLQYDLKSLEKVRNETEKEFFPLFDWFVVDNKNQLWVAVNIQGRKNYGLWVLNQEGKRIAKLNLNKNVELKAILHNYAYGIQIDDKDGTHSIVRYIIGGL